MSLGRTLLERIRRAGAECFGVDLRSLAVMRILLGFMLLWDLMVRSRYLKTFYTDEGAVPRQTVVNIWHNPTAISAYLMSGSWVWVSLMFILAGFFSFCFMIGCRTRLMGFLSWFMLIGLHIRNPLVLNGGDTMFRCVLFWCLFLPMGARYSIDSGVPSRALTEWKDRVRNLFVSVGSAGLVLQASLIYLFSALLKTGVSWQDGTAVYLALNVDYITWRAPSDFLLQYPELISFLTVSTWHLELYGPLLLLIPILRGQFRTIACFLFIGLHLGFAGFMTLGLFPFIGAAMWVGLLPGWFWDHLGRLPGVFKKMAGFRETEAERMAPQAHSRWWVQSLALMGIYGMVTWNLSTLPEKGPCPDKFTLDSNNDFCMGKAIDKKVASKLARSVPKRNNECPSGYEDNGETCSQIDRDLDHAIVPIDGTCPNTYELNGDYCIIKSAKLQHAIHPRKLTWADRELYNRDVDEWIRPLIKMVRLDQKWNMFAPNPLTNDGWHILKGQLIDGSEVKLFPSGPLDESKPEQVSDLYVDQRWRKYMRNLQTNYKTDKNRSKSENEDFKGSIFRLHFGKHVCKSYNKDRSGDARLETFQIWTMNEVTHPPSWSPRSKVHATFKLHKDTFADMLDDEGTINEEACAEACIEKTKIDAEVSRCELKDTTDEPGPLKLLEEMHSIRCSGIQLIKVKKESAPPMWSHRCLKP